MSLTLKNLDLKKINAPYPIGYIDNFLSEESCKKYTKWKNGYGLSGNAFKGFFKK